MEQAFELTFDSSNRAEKRVLAHAVETPEFVRSQENTQKAESAERITKIEQAHGSIKSVQAEAVEYASQTNASFATESMTNRIKQLKASLGGPTSYAYLASMQAGFLALMPWTKTHAHTKLFEAEHLISEGDLSRANDLLGKLEQSH